MTAARSRPGAARASSHAASGMNRRRPTAWVATLTFSSGLMPRRPRRPHRLRLLLAVIREEELLAVDLVARDRLLPLGRGQPLDEPHSQILLHRPVLRRIHQHDAVLVEE